jgi:DeoR family transcriptional regulator of aga operon
MLSRRRGLTIVTNSLTIAVEVASSPSGKVIITGGAVRGASLEAVGALAENTFKAVSVGTAIIGADGVTVDGGVTTHDELEARTANTMIHAAKRVIVVVDGSKIGRVTHARMAEARDVDVLITDATADPGELERLRRIGVAVQVVPDR